MLTFTGNIKKILVEFGPAIIEGIKTTLLLSLLGTLIGFFIALLLSGVRIIKIHKNDLVIIKIIKFMGNGFAKIYVTVFRGTPMIVQAIIFYYTFHQIGFKWSPLQAGLFTVSLNTAAYLTEIVRSAILNLDKGQEEAALSLGLSGFKTKIFILFPQAIKNSMAPICNEFVVNIKDTAVLSIIAVADLFAVTDAAAGKYYLYIEAMIIAACIYLILTYSTSLIMGFIEKKLGVKHFSMPNNTEVLS